MDDADATNHVTATNWDKVLWPNAAKTVILENVIAFDVQAYDPDEPVYAKAFNESGEESQSQIPTQRT